MSGIQEHVRCLGIRHLWEDWGGGMLFSQLHSFPTNPGKHEEIIQGCRLLLQPYLQSFPSLVHTLLLLVRPAKCHSLAGYTSGDKTGFVYVDSMVQHMLIFAVRVFRCWNV